MLDLSDAGCTEQQIEAAEEEILRIHGVMMEAYEDARRVLIEIKPHLKEAKAHAIEWCGLEMDAPNEHDVHQWRELKIQAVELIQSFGER